jgi:elongation factor G
MAIDHDRSQPVTAPPLLSIAITPSSDGDRVRLRAGLASLLREDPTLTIISDGDEIRVAGIGELQLEIVVDRLKREFNVSAQLGRPSIVYAETITRTADADFKYVDPSSHQYAHVKIRLESQGAGGGYAFVNEVTGGAVPSAFVAAVDAGAKSELERGILAGRPVIDVRVVLYDGSYHETDSSDDAFRIAAGRAVREAALQAGPVVVEPVMRVETSVPGLYLQQVTQMLIGRRGRVNTIPDADDYFVVVGYVPLAELFGYGCDLRRITFGKGGFTMRFAGYAPVEHTDGSDADRDANVGAPLRPRPAPRSSSVALPEPDPTGNDEPLTNT